MAPGPTDLTTGDLCTDGNHVNYWTEAERLETLESIDVATVQNHMKVLLTSPQITVISHGDVSADVTGAMVDTIAERFAGNISTADVVRNRLRQLDDGGRYLRTMEIDHQDTAVSYYLQSPEKSLEARARLQLLGQLLQSPFYFDL